ncbi:hypothetical protein ABGV42_01820 [Paenibacillus pabuli]|uniref:hypothetical protein n=1 Tax=Paenibacillus pabuli TaxID=1472 RepID=UPI003241C64C
MIKKLKTRWQLMILAIALLVVVGTFLGIYNFIFSSNFDENAVIDSKPDFDVSDTGITFTDSEGKKETVFPSDRDQTLDDDGLGHYKVDSKGNKERILPETPASEVPNDLREQIKDSMGWK